MLSEYFHCTPNMNLNTINAAQIIGPLIYYSGEINFGVTVNGCLIVSQGRHVYVVQDSSYFDREIHGVVQNRISGEVDVLIM